MEKQWFVRIFSFPMALETTEAVAEFANKHNLGPTEIIILASARREIHTNWVITIMYYAEIGIVE